MLCNIVQTLGQIAHIFYKDFAIEFIPKLTKLVFDYFLQSDSSSIRNFDKDKISAIIKALEQLMLRAYSLREKHQLLETFELDLAFLCFKTEFLAR